MANWKRYTDPHNKERSGYVNLDQMAEIVTYKDCDINYQPTGKEWTRILSGVVAVACDSMGGTVRENYFIDASEPIEYFLDQPSRESV